MTKTFRLLIACLMFCASVVGPAGVQSRAAVPPLPAQLTDVEFWRLTEELSEPSGYFQSDNLLSNEVYFQHVIPELVERAESGGAYIGVGPEQNFTYIAALKPKIAFIPDIRRGNLHLHLMYKALFELSQDRAEFVSRLFTRPRPSELTTKSTAEEIFAAFSKVDPSGPDAYRENLRAIEEVLSQKHKFALSSEDLTGIDYVYRNFFSFGPNINYNSSRQAGGFGGFVSYADLMMSTDGHQTLRSYLATEENFAVVKELEQGNLVVPLVGNFAGPKAVRAIGGYLKDHNATVTAFYLSNVEQFLYRNGTWPDFCRNVATLPLDAKSVFIRSTRRGFASGSVSVLGAMRSETENCDTAGR
jgi:hypothetical protein